MTPETVDDLIRRVEAATGPDRELDAEIELATNPAVVGMFPEYTAPGWLVGGGYPQPFLAASYTASVDAALALVERVLPGWRLHSLQEHGEPYWTAALLKVARPSGAVWMSAPTASLAILAALLRATRSTEA